MRWQHAYVRTCSQKKDAMVYGTRNRTMEQTMRAENAACVSRLCSADMQEALAAFVAKRRPDLQSLCS